MVNAIAAGIGRIGSGARVVGVAAAVGVGLALVAWWDPNQPGHYPTCPFLAVTGWYCPGCGSLRALHALAHGDVATALARNPALVVGVVWLGWVGVRWMRRTLTGAAARTPTGGRYARVLPLIVCAFWVVRNIPGWTFLSPA